MKSLVFIHGMSQEGKNPHRLKSEWEGALLSAWSRLQIPIPQYVCKMPFYGDVLDRLTREVYERNADVRTMGQSDTSQALDTLKDEEFAILMEFRKRMGISDDELGLSPGNEVTERGPANWPFVQAVALAVSRKMPWLGDSCLPFVRQVAAYLSRRHIHDAVNDVVCTANSESSQSTAVIVSHSLGTIVSYLLLRDRRLKDTVDLYVTLGSPLGIETVKSYLRPPSLRVPSNVRRWINAADPADYVSLAKTLDRTSFCDGIENCMSIRNRDTDPHYIADYLANDEIAREIALALQT